MKTLLLSLLVLLLATSPARAQIPRTISYQGLLCDASGNPRPDNTYSLTFRLYQGATGGDPIWVEQKLLQVKRGLFSTLLGSVVPLADAMFETPCWLSIQVESEEELSPRTKFASVAYSFNALKAETAAYADVAGSGGSSPWQISGSNLFYNSGNIGIGTNTPQASLHVDGGDVSGQINIWGNAGAILRLKDKTASLDNKLMIFRTVYGKTQFLTLTDASVLREYMLTMNHITGHVGVGTDNPQAKFHVEGGPGNTGGIVLRSNDVHSIISNDAATNRGYIQVTSGGSPTIIGPNKYDLLLNPYGGSVGIGTTTPAFKLHVAGGPIMGQGLVATVPNYPSSSAAAEFLTYEYSSTNWGGIGGYTDGGMWYRGSVHAFWAPAASTTVPAMFVGSDGNIGIGTSSPQAKAHVKGDLQVDGAMRGSLGAIGGAPFPRPAYNSGWVAIAPAYESTLYHNLGGNPDDYVVMVDFKSDNAEANIHHMNYGGDTDFSSFFRGGEWYGLDATHIKFHRKNNDTAIDKFRVRIWVIK